MTMQEFLEGVAAKLKGVKTSVTVTPVPKASGVPWKRFTLHVGDMAGEFTRPLIAVICPPSRWPVGVTIYHEDPQVTTTRRHEWGRDPNEKVGPGENPPTIDDFDELEKVVAGLLFGPVKKPEAVALSRKELAKVKCTDTRNQCEARRILKSLSE